MDERLLNTGAHQRFIRMLNDEKRNLIPKEPSHKNGMYIKLNRINDI
jgi:hypothetical protein